jgi:hypothetical protein
VRRASASFGRASSFSRSISLTLGSFAMATLNEELGEKPGSLLKTRSISAI